VQFSHDGHDSRADEDDARADAKAETDTAQSPAPRTRVKSVAADAPCPDSLTAWDAANHAILSAILKSGLNPEAQPGPHQDGEQPAP